MPIRHNHQERHSFIRNHRNQKTEEYHPQTDNGMIDSPKNSSEITGERYAPISIAHYNSNARVQPRKKFNFTESRTNTEQESAAEAKASSQHALDLPSFDQLPHTRPSHNTTLTTTPNGAHSTIGQPRNTEPIVQVGTHDPPSRTTVFPP